MDRKTYLTLFKLAGGPAVIALAFLAMLVFVCASLTFNFFLLHWAHSRRSTQDNYGVYCSVIFVTASVIALIVFAWVNTIMCLFQRASKKIHNEKLNTIFNAPVNTYWRTIGI